MAIEIYWGDWKQFLHTVTKDGVNANLTGASQVFLAVGPGGETIRHTTSDGGIVLTNPTGLPTASNPTGAQSTLTLQSSDTSGLPNARATFNYQWTTVDSLGHPQHEESGVLIVLPVLVPTA